MDKTQTITPFEFLKACPLLPTSREGAKVGHPSKSEIRRWLQKRAVIINGKRPLPDDKIEYPITELVFFPKGGTVTIMKGE